MLMNVLCGLKRQRLFIDALEQGETPMESSSVEDFGTAAHGKVHAAVHTVLVGREPRSPWERGDSPLAGCQPHIYPAHS